MYMYIYRYTCIQERERERCTGGADVFLTWVGLIAGHVKALAGACAATSQLVIPENSPKLEPCTPHPNP